MRHLRFSAAALAGLLLLALALQGCSRRAERLVGNERLRRGAGGLGTTVDSVVVLDRDTYVVPTRTANFGAALLVGRSGSYQAQALLRVSTWKLPDETLPGFAVDSVELVLPFDTLLAVPTNDMTVTLSLASATWSDETVEWLQVMPDSTLGSDSVRLFVPFRLRLPLNTYAAIKGWAAAPTSVNGFILTSSSGDVGLAGFRAGAGAFRIVYSYLDGTVSVRTRVDSPVTTDLYVHTPATQLATGSDTTLVAGGLYDYRLALRFAPPTTPEGASINRGVVRFNVRGSATKRTIEIHEITGSWLETATDLGSVPNDSTVLLAVDVAPTVAGADTVIDLNLPTSLLRKWQTNPGSNEGLLVTVRRADVQPPIGVGAREGSNGPILFVTTTTPPPGRF